MDSLLPTSLSSVARIKEELKLTCSLSSLHASTALCNSLIGSGGAGFDANVRDRSRCSEEHAELYMAGAGAGCASLCLHIESNSAKNLAVNKSLQKAIKVKLVSLEVAVLEDCLWCWGAYQFPLWFKLIAEFGTLTEGREGL